MTENTCPINPFLSTLIKGMEERVPQEILHEQYKNSGSELPWLEFLGEKALRDAIEKNPVLCMRRSSIPLPKVILDGLYWLRVDVVADLLQLTKEELIRFEKQEQLDIEQIELFLKNLGFKLYCSGSADTWKIPALRIIDPDRAGCWEQWDIASLGRHKMHPARPTLVKAWFDDYYRRHEYIHGEEKLAGEWLNIKPELEDGAIPYNLSEFFTDTQLFFTAYEKVCNKQGIKMLSKMPILPQSPDELKYFPNDRFLTIKKNVVQALISILENTRLFRMPTFQFLRASDEQKLNLAGKITNDEDFQYFLVEYVALRVDFEGVFYYFDALAAKVVAPASARPDPINPWLAELIHKYRKQHSDNSIREMYRLFCEHTPTKSWDDFVAEQALLEESTVNPFIRTEVEEWDLPKETIDSLSNNCAVENMADLLQITREELVELFESRPQDIPVIEAFLEEHELHLYHSNRLTYKISFPYE